jgi:SPX domain protein involved in polyphosphate accumulation
MIKIPTQKLHFRRFEFKYLLSRNLVNLILPILLNHMHLDPYAKKKGSYLVSSIYYDSPEFHTYHEKIDGVNPRKKYRLRFYQEKPDPKQNIFFEVKRRDDVVVTKDRVLIKTKDLSKDNLLNIFKKHAINENQTYSEIYTDFLKHNLQEKVFLSYTRIPFFSNYDFDTRVTIDQDITAQKLNSANNLNQNAKSDVYPQLSILELKCNNLIPEWFNNIVHQYSLQRVSFSKYATSVNSLYNMGDYFVFE